jgi:hypothetical protein
LRDVCQSFSADLDQLADFFQFKIRQTLRIKRQGNFMESLRAERADMLTVQPAQLVD